MKYSVRQFYNTPAATTCGFAAPFCNSFAAHIAVLLGAILLASIFCVIFLELPLLRVAILVWLAVILVRLLLQIAPKVFEPRN